jgi:hypothetical protein
MQLIEKINNKNYRIDLTTRQITFLDSRFYITEDGNYVPSVTTILEAYPKGAQYYEWLKKNGEDSDTIRDEAGRRGSVVHQLTEKFDAGEEVSLFDEHGNISCRLIEWAMFERYVEFKNAIRHQGWNIRHIEMNVISQELGFAGTIDRIFHVEKRGHDEIGNVLLDIKTSAAIYPTHLLQLSAYKELVEKETGIYIAEVAILHLNAKTRTAGKNGAIQGKSWQLIRYGQEELDHAKKIFKATKQLWDAENSGLVPRQMVYNLSHKQ